MRIGMSSILQLVIMAWSTTIAALQPLLPSGRPKLTEDLLSRPPFRFLHDIVTELQRSGFAPGLFTTAEQDARALDKEAKMVYLQKLLDTIAAVLGEAVPAHPSKIVAGLEPEATNIMLQMLAAAAQKGNGATAVQAVRRRHAEASPTSHRGSIVGSSDRTRPSLDAGELHGKGSMDEEGQDATPIVFARLENLLPVLSRRMEEARHVLTGTDAAGSSNEAWAQCRKVQAIAQDAVILAQCLEALHSSAHIVTAECAAWGKEADKVAARVEHEERAEAEAAAIQKAKVSQLEEDIAAARRRVVSLVARRA